MTITRIPQGPFQALKKVEDGEGDERVDMPAMEGVDAFCLVAATWVTR
jgi:hypothetical protein